MTLHNLLTFPARIRIATNTLLVFCCLLLISCGSSERQTSDFNPSSSRSNLLSFANMQKLSAKKNIHTHERRFGSSVMLSDDGTSALIASLVDPRGGFSIEADSVYYKPTSGIWRNDRLYHIPMVAYDELPPEPRHLEAAISGDGNIIVAGYSGNIGIYRKAGSRWDFAGYTIGRGRCSPLRVGYAVAVSLDGTIVAASCPSADAFRENVVVLLQREVLPSGWVQWSQIQSISSPRGEVHFGRDLSISSNGKSVLVNGRVQDMVTWSWKWVTYMFDFGNDFTLKRTSLLDPIDGEFGNGFGKSLSISADGLTALLGAPYQGEGSGGPYFGAAYVFSRSDLNTPFSQQKLSVNRPTSDRFGDAVALSSDGQRALIGAPLEANGSIKESGAAYLFSRQGSGWHLQSTIREADAGPEARFGQNVALNRQGTVALIGAPTADSGATPDPSLPASGKAYIYSIRHQNGDECTAGDECVSGFCVDGVCCNSTCGGGASGDCQACSKALGAVVDGTCGNVTAKASITCRPARSVCDLAETCDGMTPTCPPDIVVTAPSVLCRVKAGYCDKPEYCDGISPLCPDDKRKTKTERCSDGDCASSALCDGVSATCPDNPFKKNGEVCRKPTNSDCFEPGSCPGDSANCPDKTPRATSYECISESPCSYASKCDGSVICPSALPKPKGEHCGSGDLQCDGSGKCEAPSSYTSGH